MCIMRQIYRKVNSTIIHMLVINITYHIMDIQVFQMDMVNRTCILRNSSHTGTIHHIGCVIDCINLGSFIHNLQILNLNIFAVIQ